MFSNISSCTSCHHTSHLFCNPLCKEQSLIRKIVNIAFHILTLGIPFLFYYVVSFCFACCKRESVLSLMDDEYTDDQLIGRGFDDLIIHSRINFLLSNTDEALYNQPSIPQEGIEALKFARKELRKYYKTETPDLIKESIVEGMNNDKSPVNKEIVILKHIAEHNVFNQFKEQLQCFGENAWNEPAVFKAADNAYKIIYALSILVVDDVDSYCQKYGLEEKEMICSEEHKSYFENFYLLTCLYHRLRNRSICRGEKIGYSVPVAESHIKLFFTEQKNETPCASWRRMYNDYCQRVKCCFNEDKLKQKVPKFILWIQLDIDPKSFHHNPDKIA